MISIRSCGLIYSIRKLWIVIAGYALLAVGCLFFFLPSLPEVLKSVHLATGINLDDQMLNDKASGIYNTFYYLGSIMAPPIGGALNDSIGYRSTNDLMALVTFLFTLAYLIFNVLCIEDHDGFGVGDSIYTLTNDEID